MLPARHIRHEAIVHDPAGYEGVDSPHPPTPWFSAQVLRAGFSLQSSFSILIPSHLSQSLLA
jgi:hypothetical protein